MYAKIENDKIVSIGPCPNSIGNTTGINNADDSFKEQFGYYKIVDEPPLVESWETLNKLKVELIDGIPVQQYEVISKTLDEHKDSKKEKLRKYVQPKFPEIYEQVNALLGDVYDTTKNNKIIKEIKDWNKYIDDKKLEIDALSTHEEIESFNVMTSDDLIIPGMK